MSKARREIREYLRNQDVFAVDDAVRFARDISWASNPTPADDGDMCQIEWQTGSVARQLYVFDGDSTASPNYTLDIQDTILGTRKIYNFSGTERTLRVEVLNKYGSSHVLGNADDFRDLIDHLSSNELGVQPPNMDRSGDRQFEILRAHYAIHAAIDSGDIVITKSMPRMSDDERKASLKEDIVQASLQQGLQIDDVFYPYTRSSGLVRMALDEHLEKPPKST